MRSRSLLVLFPALAGLLFGLACNLTSTAQPAPTAAVVVVQPEVLPAATEATAETPAAGEAVEPLPLPTEATSAPGETAPTPAPAGDPAACPQPGEGQALFTSLDDGFCFLYPAAFTPTVSTEGSYAGVTIRAPRPPLDPRQMEAASPSLRVEYNGPADGLSSEAYFARWLEVFGLIENPEFQAATLGGQPAVILTNLPYFFYQQSAFMVAYENKYRVILSPRLGEDPALDDSLRLMWETMSASLVFFPPQHSRSFIRPEQVCPQPQAETLLYISLIDGYCLLYPADFTSTPGFSNQFVGGPVLGDYEDFKDVRTSLTVGYSGYFPGMAVSEAMAGRLLTSDTIEETSIKGYPALTYRNAAGPWPSRDASISANGRIYTILAQPWAPLRWPQGIPLVDRVWDTVIGSIEFFDPWR